MPTIYIQCDAECQTDFSVTMDTAEADLSPTTNPKSYHQPPTPESRPVPAPRHQPPTPKSRPVPAPRTSLSTKSRPTPAPRTSLCTQPTPAHIPVPTIPCSNRFELLQTEHCNDTPTCGKIKQVPPPSTDLIVNMEEPPIPKPEPTATHQPRTVLIIGDSIPKYLDGKCMSRHLNVINECIPGSKIETWIKLVPSYIREYNPFSIIVHCGTNNIRKTYPMECLTLLIKLLNTISQTDSRIKIAVSSLTTQMNYGRYNWITEFNARLFESCELFQWTFIDNRNITSRYLAIDGLHLSRSGTTRLAGNFISFLRQIVKDNMNT